MFNYLHNIMDCIVEKDFGKKIKNESLGKSMVYLFIFMLIVGSLFMLKTDLILFNSIIEETDNVKYNFANFEIKDGKFIYYGAMPVVKVEEGFATVIDTTGTTNEEILNKYEGGIFISETKFVVKNATEERKINFSDYKGYNLTKTELLNSIQIYTIPVLSVIFILGVIVLYLLKLLAVFIFSVAPVIMTSRLKLNIDYSNILQVTIYSITLPTIIKCVLFIFNVNIPFFFILYYLIATYYIVRYLKLYKNETLE